MVALSICATRRPDASCTAACATTSGASPEATLREAVRIWHYEAGDRQGKTHDVLRWEDLFSHRFRVADDCVRAREMWELLRQERLTALEIGDFRRWMETARGVTYRHTREEGNYYVGVQVATRATPITEDPEDGVGSDEEAVPVVPEPVTTVGQADTAARDPVTTRRRPTPRRL